VRSIEGCVHNTFIFDKKHSISCLQVLTMTGNDRSFDFECSQSYLTYQKLELRLEHGINCAGQTLNGSFSVWLAGV
jgi:hypothetical protein